MISLSPDRELAESAAAALRDQRADDAPTDEGTPRDAKFLDEWEQDDGSLTVTPLEGLLEPRARQPVGRGAEAL